MPKSHYVGLANAGHLNPYQNGQEIEVEPELPLSIAPGPESQCSRPSLETG